MNELFHIAGDGVAGLALAAELQAHGARVVVHGDRLAHAPIFTLVHRYAGRSFRTTAFDDRVWEAATSWLDRLVEVDVVARVSMARPRASRAGDRLARSLQHAESVSTEPVPPFGDCFVYEPAYVVDVAGALEHLAGLVETQSGRRGHDAIQAVGAASKSLGVEHFGGHLVQFDGDLNLAVSGGGIHAVPTPRGVCVGSTWFDPADALDDEEAAVQLRERAEALGLELGDVQSVWSGVRAVYQSDRRPLVGFVGDEFLLAAFGTRGWYWAAYAAHQAANALLDGVHIDPLIDAARCLQP